MRFCVLGRLERDSTIASNIRPRPDSVSVSGVAITQSAGPLRVSMLPLLRLSMTCIRLTTKVFRRGYAAAPSSRDADIRPTCGRAWGMPSQHHSRLQMFRRGAETEEQRGGTLGSSGVPGPSKKRKICWEDRKSVFSHIGSQNT